MKIFLSYPNILQPIVENIYRHLPQGAFETWLDTERLSAGAPLSDIIRNIRDSEWFISFINAAAMSSESVATADTGPSLMLSGNFGQPAATR